MLVSRVLGDDHYKQMPRVTVIWHVKEPSLRNDHRCRAEVKIISPSPVMATSPNVWKFSSGTKNSKNKHTTPGLSLFGMLMPWHNLYIYTFIINELYVWFKSLYFPLSMSLSDTERLLEDETKMSPITFTTFLVADMWNDIHAQSMYIVLVIVFFALNLA